MRGHVGALALLSVAALVFDLGGFGALAALGDGGGRGRNADAEHGEAPPPAERASVARPDEVTVVVECALGPKGAFDVVVVPSWAPLGAARFLALVDDSFFDGAAMFRAVERFLVQFGISADRDLNVKWTNQRMTDDPKLGVRIGRGTLAFAGGGKDSRAMQMFIALSDHSWPHLVRSIRGGHQLDIESNRTTRRARSHGNRRSRTFPSRTTSGSSRSSTPSTAT